MVHSVIFIPGLGNRKAGIMLLTKHWKRYGFEPIVHSVGWNSEPWQPKEKRLVELIGSLSAAGNRVSIVGISAGASAAMNAFALRKEIIHRAISLCGCISVRDAKTKAGLESRAFRESLTAFETQERNLSSADRQRILTLYPRFGDGRIERDDSLLEGSRHVEIPCGGHALSIGLTLTIFSQPLILLLRQ